MCRIASLVTEAERNHVRRRASLVVVACFIPGRAKDLSAPLYNVHQFDFTSLFHQLCNPPFLFHHLLSQLPPYNCRFLVIPLLPVILSHSSFPCYLSLPCLFSLWVITFFSVILFLIIYISLSHFNPL